MAILLNSCYDIFHSISYIIVKVAVCYYGVQCNSIDYVRERCPQIKKKHNTYMNNLQGDGIRVSTHSEIIQSFQTQHY